MNRAEWLARNRSSEAQVKRDEGGVHSRLGRPQRLFYQFPENLFTRRIPTIVMPLEEESPKDAGHDALIISIESLLEDAKSGFYHDYRSIHPTPKIMLVKRLRGMIENTTAGLYDN